MTGHELRIFRVTCGLKQAEMGRLCGVSQDTISRCEGKAAAIPAYLDVLCYVLRNPAVRQAVAQKQGVAVRSVEGSHP